MPPKLALICCCAFVLWLFRKDRKWHKGVSSAVWIPLAWALILGSKPISLWFFGDESATAEDSLDGSPFDRLVFLLLIIAAVFVLAKRRINWNLFFRKNRWLSIYFIFWGISVLWSEFPFVAFKRWIKDVGNVLMVLVVLTEQRPLSAIKALLARCVYLLIPFSVLLIKYYPEIGRYYSRWFPYGVYFCGVTYNNKNMLGMVLYVAGLSLAWLFVSKRAEEGRFKDKSWVIGFFLLIAMTLWLLFNTDSSTALGSALLGAGIILALQFPAIRRRVKRMGAYGLAVISLLLLLEFTVNLSNLIVGALGRDLTFTGRTEIWQAVLKEDINPLIGTGFYSFWLGDRVEKLSEQYYYHLGEAHSGYIEIYLTGGFIGVLLLLILLSSAIKRIAREVALDSSYGKLQLAFMITSIIYGITEAIFDRPDLIWFVLLLMLVQYAPPRRASYGGATGVVPEQPARTKSNCG
jgi:exopolysaccharide production protein ExoQ